MPRVRISAEPGKTDWIERILVEVVSEGLRCDVFVADATRRADASAIADAVILPRPPELFDLAETTRTKVTIIYPDPPLGRTELEILEKIRAELLPDLEMKTLSQV